MIYYAKNAAKYKKKKKENTRNTIRKLEKKQTHLSL